MRSDPWKVRDWQNRSARRYAQRRRPSRNDSAWRVEVFAKRGTFCRACGTSRWPQADHLIPRSQGGKSVVQNGLPLCLGCHAAKTAGQLRIRREWLDPDQVEWLAEQGHVAWTEAGETVGLHRKLFVEETQ